ncbi:MAG: alpha/beta hydrolase, partial [Bacteroidota bacterium]
ELAVGQIVHDVDQRPIGMGIQLAAESPDLVDALMMYSPNIAIADPSAQLLTMPWGAEIGRAVIGERRTITEIKDKPAGQFTTEVYRLEGLIALQALLDQTMTDENFGQITQPYLIAYYYKNEEEQDPIVSVPAMLDFDAKTSTVKEMTRVVALPDVGNHVMTSSIYSKDLESVAKVSQEFAEAVLGMEKKQ